MSSDEAFEMLEKWSTARTALECISRASSDSQSKKVLGWIRSVTPVGVIFSPLGGGKEEAFNLAGATFGGSTPSATPDNPSAAFLEIWLSDGGQAILTEETSADS
ncbi:MAG TPA: hypothetical protein VMB85_08745 [Bryobacteraceae bacterium]|nr:hypothetical protein [Bryobacteraceae bacterium]